MVFDEDGKESPRQGKGHRRHEKDDPIERKSRGQRDQEEMVGSGSKDRYGDRNRGGRYERGARDVDSRVERKDRDKYTVGKMIETLGRDMMMMVGEMIKILGRDMRMIAGQRDGAVQIIGVKRMPAV